MNELVPGIIVLALMAFCSLVYVILWATREHNCYERFWKGRKYSTRTSLRIFGICGEHVVEGQWTACVESVWRTYQKDYFILTVDELDPPRIEPVTRSKAMAFINKHAEPDLTRSLLAEWFGESPIMTQK